MRAYSQSLIPNNFRSVLQQYFRLKTAQKPYPLALHMLYLSSLLIGEYLFQRAFQVSCDDIPSIAGALTTNSYVLFYFTHQDDRQLTRFV